MSAIKVLKRTISFRAKKKIGEASQVLPWMYIGEKGKILKTNSIMDKLLGYKPGALRGTDFRKLFCAADRNRELPEAQSILTASQEEYTTWASLKRKNGEALSASLVYKRIKPTGRKGARDLRKPFSSEMLIWVLAAPRQAELENLVGSYQERLELFFNERKRVQEALLGQLRVPLAVLALAVSTLKNEMSAMSAQQINEELERMAKNLGVCQKTLESMAREWTSMSAAASCISMAP